MPAAAGPGFAAAVALSRGMADLSMEGGEDHFGKMYEFKENDEKQQYRDDIDDFERRLAGAPSKLPVSKPGAAPIPRTAPPSKSGATACRKPGAEYVQEGKAHNAAANKAKPASKKNADDEFADEDESARVKQDMADLNRFDRDFGGGGDDDDEDE